MTVVYTNSQDRLVLDDSDLVGTGGEGSVFKDPQNRNGLIKVYENPTKQHGQKLTDFINHQFHLPKNVAAPTEVVYNNRGQIIGFRMPFFKNASPFRKLSDNKYCRKESIGAKNVVELHLQKLNILDTIHTQGIVEGDLNDLNNLFKNNQTISIDVDSWQFGSWPCSVATENFLNPRLYNIDLSQKAYFTPDDDWYSFAVLLHRGLLKVHPYGGTHPTVNNLPTRAKKRITVHDKGVIYPAVGLKSEVVSDDLSEVFHQFFKQGKIKPFPRQLLEQFVNSLTTCPNCQQEYPKNRRECPNCQEQNQAALNITIPGSVTYKELLKVSGNIIFHKLENSDTLLVVAVDNNIATLYITNAYGVQQIPLFNYQRGMHLDVSSKLVVTNDGQSDILRVYRINNDRIELHGELVTNIYAGNSQAVFKVNNQHIFHIIGSQLVDTTVFHNQFLHQPIRQVMTNQTWFSANSDIEFVCLGFHRVLRQQFFWLSRQNYSIDIKLPFLDIGEGLLDISVKYSHKEILVLRRTKLQGKEYVRLDHLNFDGQVLFSQKYEAGSLPSDSIHGQGFSKGNLIYPTDQGAVRLKPSDNSLANFSSTNKLVTSDHAIYLYQQGLLVIGNKSVHQLTLN